MEHSKYHSSPRLESQNTLASSNGGFGRTAFNVLIGVAIVGIATHALLGGCCTPTLSGAETDLALAA